MTLIGESISHFGSAQQAGSKAMQREPFGGDPFGHAEKQSPGQP
jgi:hypothetical protein